MYIEKSKRPNSACTAVREACVHICALVFTKIRCDAHGGMGKEFKSFYKEVGGNEGTLCHYNTRLDTYGCGCQHDCSYCYAKSLLDFRGLWDNEEPAEADLEKIKRKLNRVPAGTVLRLGGMTDCFQPIEAKRGITFELIKELNRRQIHYLIVTKSALVATDKYMAVLDKGLAHIQISITATDDDVARRYEKASPISARIEAIEKLNRGGYDVAIRLSPFIPEFVDIEKINAIQCDKILVEFLRSNGFIRRTFDQVDYSKYTLVSGNYKHLPLEDKLKLLEQITIPNRSVCDDVPEHYEYFKHNFNSNPDDCCNLSFSKRAEKMNIIEMAVADLVPYENNPRKNDEAVDKVALSISAFGFKVPIVIDSNNVVVTGHTRLKAAKKLGLTTVPCIKADDLTDEQIKAFRLADNKVGEFSEWDEDKLAKELEELADIDMSLYGFEFPDDDDLGEGEDDTYSNATNIPQYEITGEVPALSDLVDIDKTNELVEEIEASDLPYDEKEFLRMAAQRHLVFNYKKVAEYYAAASPEMQELMEKSALVIIDYNDAIMNGYTALSEKIQKLMEADKGA